MDIELDDEFLSIVAGVLSQRGDQYQDEDGTGTQHHISIFWSEWLNTRYAPKNGKEIILDSTDVAAMMIFVKLVRLSQSVDIEGNWETLKDSLIDIGGYASILYESVKRET